jgi:ubiquinone/menaquinone biosynthesis C-methylase UbiE
MAVPRVLMRLPIHSLLRCVLLLPLILNGVFGQSAQPQPEEAGVAEMKRRVIELLQLRPGDTAADVGCGDGFYTIPLAQHLTPSGKVLAIDIDEGALSKLREHLAEKGLRNVEIIKGAEDDPKLPVARVDAALIVNAYHEMTKPKPMLRHVLAALKPGALLILMEGISDIREKNSRDEQTKHHQLAPAFAKQEIEAAGFDIVEVRDPFTDRPPDVDEKSRWWVIIARKPSKV